MLTHRVPKACLNEALRNIHVKVTYVRLSAITLTTDVVIKVMCLILGKDLKVTCMAKWHN